MTPRKAAAAPTIKSKSGRPAPKARTTKKYAVETFRNGTLKFSKTPAKLLNM